MEQVNFFIKKIAIAQHSDVDEILGIIRDLGYEGGRRELLSALREAGWKSGELSEEELAFVSGGNLELLGCPCNSPCSTKQKCFW